MTASDWHAVETIYRKGIAKQLRAAFLDASDAAGIWAVQSGVFPENESSLALQGGGQPWPMS